MPAKPKQKNEDIMKEFTDRFKPLLEQAIINKDGKHKIIYVPYFNICKEDFRCLVRDWKKEFFNKYQVLLHFSARDGGTSVLIIDIYDKEMCNLRLALHSLHNENEKEIMKFIDDTTEILINGKSVDLNLFIKFEKWGCSSDAIIYEIANEIANKLFNKTKNHLKLIGKGIYTV